MNLTLDLLLKVEKWCTKRAASSFTIEVRDYKKALSVQAELRRNGYKSSIIWIGRRLEIWLFLIDNPKPG